MKTLEEQLLEWKARCARSEKEVKDLIVTNMALSSEVNMWKARTENLERIIKENNE